MNKEQIFYRLAALFLVLSATAFTQAKSQSTHIISPREYSTAPPSEYPSGIYIMDSENAAPYNWVADAGMVLGLKRSQTNHRHIQMLIWRDGSRIGIRGKNGQHNAWVPWKYFPDEAWVEDNFVKKEENGNVGIGITSPTAKLAVNGTTKTKEIIVTEQGSDWPDYVFSDADYLVPDLMILETYINEHKHLPGIPTKQDIEQSGQNLGAIQGKLLEKIEELTLYVIEQQKRIEVLEKELQGVQQVNH